MEKVWYSVLLFILINQVFATDRNCSPLDSINSCNECIRCHGYWCNNPKEPYRCVATRDDDWCVSHQEPVPIINDVEVPGTFFSRKFRTKTIHSGMDLFEVTFPYKGEAKVTISSNSTQEPVEAFNTTSCKDGVCTVSIESQPDTGFCRNDGRVEEFYTIAMKVNGSDEEVVMRNHVPCACECSLHVEVRSTKCSERGNFSCGTCECEKGWHGETCELRDVATGGTKGTTAGAGHACDHGVWIDSKCQCNEPWHGDSCQQRDTKFDYRCKGHGIWSDGKCQCHGHWSGEFCDTCNTRGDIAACSVRNEQYGECSGHGICECGCVCFNNTIGSRYFDPTNYCEDLCMAISNDCDTCAFTSKPGRCDECKFPLTRQPYVESRLEERDELNRDMWVRCNDTLDGCTVEYVAMRDDAGETFIMIVKSCDPVTGAATGPVAVTVPILLGVLLPLVAVLAAAGFYLWKNRTPPLPLTDPEYQNIDAEDCTGENPLYKPPTSSFKNPTYGKWQ
ncbi:integrin beta-6-like [Aricia agestis]|uniref:integrin beta-6-like n=1 Tax=Aricia agestis TaxID=91739 RepID=UPI001C207E3D|nr:integrin beta-6-like [Aricia agestis]